MPSLLAVRVACEATGQVVETGRGQQPQWRSHAAALLAAASELILARMRRPGNGEGVHRTWTHDPSQPQAGWPA